MAMGKQGLVWLFLRGAHESLFRLSVHLCHFGFHRLWTANFEMANCAAWSASPELVDKFKFLLGILFDPVIFSAFAAAFLASLAWMAAMTRFDLSHAYPFMSLNFVVVFLLSGLLLSESMTMQKSLGVGLIV